MKLNKQGFAPIFIIILLLIAVVFAGGAYYLVNQSKPVILDNNSNPLSPFASALPGPEFSPLPEPSFIPNPASQSPVSGSSAALPKAMELAKADLAAKIYANLSQISISKMDKTDWPDASLGCPKEGVMYAQVVTSGYKVILAYNQVQYEYHTDLNDQFVQCQNPQ